MTARQNQIVEAYRGFFDSGRWFTLGDVAKITDGEDSRTTRLRVNTMICLMRKAGTWPFPYKNDGNGNGHVEKATPRSKKQQESEDRESEVIRDIVRLLNTLRLKSMRKVLNIIKENILSMDEMMVLKEIAKSFDELDDQEKDRVSHYINCRFNI